MFSLIIPVYGNEGSLPELVQLIECSLADAEEGLEVVFVVDGSPDRSLELLLEILPGARFRSQVLSHSRNFGSFSAIRTGLAAARGDFLGVMAADLQEPIDLISTFREALLSGEYDVILGCRESRSDPRMSRMFSFVFWKLYRKFIQTEMPAGGADVFACTRRFRDELLRLRESSSTLIGLVLWLGFRRLDVPYSRLPRRHGKSGWSFARKLRYLSDSVFAFSDLPMRLIGFAGVLGMLLAVAFGLVVLIARTSGLIAVPGYAATVLTVTFFGGLNAFGIGTIGGYVWRVFENTKGRPAGLVEFAREFDGRRDQ